MPGTTVEVIELTLAEGLKISGKGFQNCTVDDLAFEGPDRAARTAQGRPAGTRRRVLGPAERRSTSPSSRSSRTRHAALLRRVEPGSASPCSRRSRARSPAAAASCRITDPAGAAPAGPGVDASLTGLNQISRPRRARTYLVASTGCKSSRHVDRHAACSPRRADGAPVPAPTVSADDVDLHEVAPTAHRSLHRRPRLGGAVGVPRLAARARLRPRPRRPRRPARPRGALHRGRGRRARRLVRSRSPALWSRPHLQDVARAAAVPAPARRRRACSARSGVARLRRRPYTPASPAPSSSATTSRRRWSTSPSGSACRSPRCCSATSGGC